MKNRYSVEQIVTALKQVELGEKATDVCRKLGSAKRRFTFGRESTEERA